LSSVCFADCQRGECGVCAIDFVAVEGEIDHRDVFFSDQQKHDNRKIRPCVSRAIGVVTIDTLYRRKRRLVKRTSSDRATLRHLF